MHLLGLVAWLKKGVWAHTNLRPQARRLAEVEEGALTCGLRLGAWLKLKKEHSNLRPQARRLPEVEEGSPPSWIRPVLHVEQCLERGRAVPLGNKHARVCMHARTTS